MLELRIREKTFTAIGDAPARTVFRDFALDVPAGQLCVIAGPSGVGKSTLLAIVSGLDRNWAGRIEGHAARIGFMFQTPRLLPWLSALRNVELAVPEHKGCARHWLNAVGLEGSVDVYPQRLSLGMARRVDLARALAIEPTLLLLDEPFASLDAANATHVAELLSAEANRRRMTVLLVSHELGLARELAHRVITLEGTPARIVRDVGVNRAVVSKGLAVGQELVSRSSTGA
jgi:ABC-type nitrate/sulfonate/bicarbonate transport system ATPase subunit